MHAMRLVQTLRSTLFIAVLLTGAAHTTLAGIAPPSNLGAITGLREGIPTVQLFDLTDPDGCWLEAPLIGIPLG